MKPNVLHFIGSFHQGGSERQAAQLVRLLSKSDRYRVHVACLDGSGVLRDEVERLGLGEIPEFPLASFYDGNALKQLMRCVQMLRARRIAIVQTHDFYTNVFGLAAAALARVPVRIAARRETMGMRTRAQKRVELSAYRLAHAVVANAEAVARQLQSEGVRPAKVRVIYNGVDPARVQPKELSTPAAALAALGIEEAGGRCLVTLVANLRHPVKDQAMFLRAAQCVRVVVPDAGFVLAGEGELLEPLRAQAAQLGLGREVFFTGRCDRVAELLAVSEVCVLSSRAEGFSNAILEYMAAGRPVVATDVGGARETVSEGETGFLVASGDAQAMAARIIALLTDPDRARAMGERGRQVITEKFSCEAQLKRTSDLYDQLLARAQRPALAGVSRSGTQHGAWRGSE